jgi:hypothetical protein
MKLSEQVCTLEQAIILTALGINPKLSAFEHCINGSGYPIILERDGTTRDSKPAFTVAELGVMLPNYTATWFGNNNMGETAWITDSLVSICEGNSRYDAAPEAALNTEAEARANRLCELLESGKVTPDEVNTRLSA